ncbi:MAG: glyceraldehyde 3-phosphate dehydrogenase NAD-binding domain-containing protein [Cypionkella sp.]|nr:glyceraldehyde 3-phosphate dehydrogenase NAD-binding domain-containing protein [Cypionkella sp.]
MRVFINGFGRIGRTVLRAWARDTASQMGLEIVGINDIANAQMCAYLFEYDSVFGPYPGQVTLQEGGRATALVVDGRAIPIHQTADLAQLDLRGVDVVLECTGRAGTRDVAQRGITAGARRVLISGPSEAADFTVVLGANDDALARPAHRFERLLHHKRLGPFGASAPRHLGRGGGNHDHDPLLHGQSAYN